ncbi:hypothetical protein BDQ12DRAFT_710238 [Crucibulum laeve]|uniref:C3H1-type domain-containing protein n=1 Tax=Crucibulum laeve TaxID=68775 RepID=A0A5C3MAE9_9AGAR|nr:hypothetical protein BDQ12DRAFT_710238 [Crucibulum laeve]
MPQIRCMFYTEDGSPINGGCRKTRCDFIHPHQPTWAQASISKNQVGRFGAGRGEPRMKSWGQPPTTPAADTGWKSWGKDRPQASSSNSRGPPRRNSTTSTMSTGWDNLIAKSNTDNAKDDAEISKALSAWGATSNTESATASSVTSGWGSTAGSTAGEAGTSGSGNTADGWGSSSSNTGGGWGSGSGDISGGWGSISTDTGTGQSSTTATAATLTSSTGAGAVGGWGSDSRNASGGSGSTTGKTGSGWGSDTVAASGGWGSPTADTGSGWGAPAASAGVASGAGNVGRWGSGSGDTTSGSTGFNAAAAGSSMGHITQRNDGVRTNIGWASALESIKAANGNVSQEASQSPTTSFTRDPRRRISQLSIPSPYMSPSASNFTPVTPVPETPAYNWSQPKTFADISRQRERSATHTTSTTIAKQPKYSAEQFSGPKGRIQLYKKLIKYTQSVVKLHLDVERTQAEDNQWKRAQASQQFERPTPATKHKLESIREDYVRKVNHAKKRFEHGISALVELPNFSSTTTSDEDQSIDVHKIMRYTAELKDWVKDLQLDKRLHLQIEEKSIAPIPPIKMQVDDKQPSELPQPTAREMLNKDGCSWGDMKLALVDLESQIAQVTEEIYGYEYMDFPDLQDKIENAAAAVVEAKQKAKDMKKKKKLDEITTLSTNSAVVGKQLEAQADNAAQLIIKIRAQEEELAKIQAENSAIEKVCNEAERQLEECKKWAVEDAQKIEEMRTQIQNLPPRRPRRRTPRPATVEELIPHIQALVDNHLKTEVAPILDALRIACIAANEQLGKEVMAKLEPAIRQTEQNCQLAQAQAANLPPPPPQVQAQAPVS